MGKGAKNRAMARLVASKKDEENGEKGQALIDLECCNKSILVEYIVD